MKRLFFCVMALGVLLSAPAAAQDDAQAENQAALLDPFEASDSARAEAAAEAALAASEARDGDGGRTAEFALNLASVRLARGERTEASAPAQRAHAIARAGGAIDPLLAEIVLLRTELETGARADTRLRDVIEAAAREERFFDGQLFEAAVDLGQFLLERHRYADAQDPWMIAVQASAGETPVWTVRRAIAFRGLGIAFLGDRGGRVVWQRLPDAVRAVVSADAGPNRAARACLEESLRLLTPLASRPAADEALTDVQVEWAETRAWLTMFYVRLSSLGLYASPPDGPWMTFSRIGATSRPCTARLVREPPLRYPANAARRSQIGAVVVRFVTDEHGSVVQSSVVAHANSDDFIETVNAATPQWSFERLPAEHGTCSLAMVVFVPIGFRLR